MSELEKIDKLTKTKEIVKHDIIQLHKLTKKNMTK